VGFHGKQGHYAFPVGKNAGTKFRKRRIENKIIVPENRDFADTPGTGRKAGNGFPVTGAYVLIQQGRNILLNRQGGYILPVKKIPVYKEHDENEEWNYNSAGNQKPGLGLNFHYSSWCQTIVWY